MLLAFLLIFLIFMAGFALAGFIGPPWVPTRKRDIEAILDDAQLKKDQTFIELGCGDGRVLKAAARRGAIAIGYEINPALWLVAKLRNISNSAVKVHLANFWDKDLSQANVLFAFLVPKYMGKLETKAAADLKRGTLLISYVFSLPKKRVFIKKARWLIYKY